MDDRRDKILDVAVELAEEGGFDNVRQRDVAAMAGVALGTLYKSFRSKEQLLCAAMEREAELLERRMETNPAKGESPEERVVAFLRILTRGFFRKPKFARAVLRAMASGVPAAAATVIAYHGRINGLMIAALRGVGRLSFNDATAAPPTANEGAVAMLMQQIWFAALVGWSAGVSSQAQVMEQVEAAATIVFRGVRGSSTGPFL